MEEILRGLEKEIAELKEQAEQVERERYATQDGVRGELVGLADTWKKGIGRLVEVEVAAEQVRGEILERRRGVRAA